MNLSIRQQGRTAGSLFVAGQEGDREYSAMLDADLISGLSVVLDGAIAGTSRAFRVTISGDEGRLLTMAGGRLMGAVGESRFYLTTSIELSDIEAAIRPSAPNTARALRVRRPPARGSGAIT